MRLEALAHGLLKSTTHVRLVVQVPVVPYLGVVAKLAADYGGSAGTA